MRQVFKLYYDFNKTQLKIIEELSYHTTKLYNIVNYDIRSFGYAFYKVNAKNYENNLHSQYLASHNYQQCLKVLEQNWKSFFEAIKEWKINPKKFNGKPRRPKFKHIKKNKNEVIFTKNLIQGARSGKVLKNGNLRLTLSKKMQNKYGAKTLNFNMKNVKIPNKIGLRSNFSNIQQIRFAFDKKLKVWYFIFIYEVEEKIPFPYLDTMAIDLGLNNLATIVFNRSKETYIIDGKVLKCKQSYYNKKISIMVSKEMKRLKDNKKFKDTKRIKRIRKKFNNFCKNYIHVTSKIIVDLAIKNNCSKIVIGDFKGIKNGNKAKLFVKIPHTKLIELIKYKAKKAGIKVIMVNESYTSGCSCLDGEKVGKNAYNKKRRISRGMFRSNQGILINADVNGAYNILYKFTKTSAKSISEYVVYSQFKANNMYNGAMTSPRMVCTPLRLMPVGN